MKAVASAWTVTALILFATQVLVLAAGKRALPGHVPPAVAHLAPAGRLPDATRLQLAIGLHLRHPEALASLLQQIYDPASRNYRQYLTPEQFAGRFGPTAQDYEAVIAFAKENGLTVTGRHSNRLLLDVSGPVLDIERTFQVALRLYPHPTEARAFYAPDAEPSVETDLPIQDVSGLDNYIVPHPTSLTVVPSGKVVNATPMAGSGPGGTYMGSDFRAAYVPGMTLTGTGQAVGLLEFDGYYPDDITTYARQAGLPDVPLTTVLMDGFDGQPGANNSEVALEIEVVLCMAPGLSQVVLYEGTIANDILNRMATDNLAKQLSCSWTWGAGPRTSTDQIFQQFAAQGQSFFQASGDAGAYTGSIGEPADNPYLTIVGGTTLTTSGPGGSWVAETTWNWNSNGTRTNASGGGISTYYPVPTWQQGLDMAANLGSTTWRNTPDVAMLADRTWVIYDNGKSSAFGGTSIAAPLWAAFTALVNQQAADAGAPTVGFINPAIYAIGQGPSYASAFHDITTGSNTNAWSPQRFFAVPGYDLCTGWGTPAGQNLIDVLAGRPDALRIIPPAGFTATGPVGGPFSTTTQSFSLTNSGLDSLGWAIINTSSWLEAAPSGGFLAPGGPAATVTISLNSTASNLAAGAYPATVWFTNQSSAVAQKREFSLVVGQTLVQNGGFESGSFSSWTPSGNFDVANDYESVVAGPTSTYSGVYGASLGPRGSLGYLSQTLPTLAGQPYWLSFWLQSLDGLHHSGTTPNEFQVAWNTNASTTNTILNKVNLGAFGWTNMQFLVTAAGGSTVLQFGFRNDPSYFALDDISVVPIAAPAFQRVTQTNDALTFTWSAMAGVPYQLQYKADLAETNWLAAGSTIRATGGTAVASDLIGSGSQRFYRVIVSP